MDGKIGSSIGWGIGAIRLIAKNNLVIAFKNREILSSVKETIAQIKSQEDGNNSPV